MKKIFSKLVLGLAAIAAFTLGLNPVEARARAASGGQGAFSSCTVTTGNGQIRVRYICNLPSDAMTQVSIFLYDRPNATAEELTEDPQGDLEGVMFLGYGSEGSYAFKGLVNGKTYYVYMEAAVLDDGSLDDTDREIWCVGAFVPAGSPFELYLDRLEARIACAEPGSVIEMEKGVTAVSNAIMQALVQKGDVSLRLEYTYEETDYVIVIPAGEAVNDDIPWYGPLYLAARYGNLPEEK